MSHWRKHTTNVLEDVDKSLLTKALADMGGLEMDESTKNIRNSYGSEAVDAALKKNGRVIALGFNFKPANGKISLELTGDFYDTGLNESSFIDRLAQNYMKHKAEKAFSEQGWIMDVCQTNANGEIVMEAYQWA